MLPECSQIQLENNFSTPKTEHIQLVQFVAHLKKFRETGEGFKEAESLGDFLLKKDTDSIMNCLEYKELRKKSPL